MEFQVIPNEQTPRVPDIDNLEQFYREHSETLKEFLEYAKTRNDAVGLAANQCSVNGERLMLRAFALRDMSTKEWSLVVNPIIDEYVGLKEIKHEGCLTWKMQMVIAERSRGVYVSYYNEIGGKTLIELHHGFEGQIWQHEINHLNGVEEKIMSLLEIPKEPKSIEVGRNEPCPCGSGKKYKNCCLKLI